MSDMARVVLDIEDGTSRFTLKAILEASGHEIVEDGADVAIADRAEAAVAHARTMASLVLAQASEVAGAVAAMQQGVFGYVFVPFQPGEAGIMVDRALAWHRGGPSVPSAPEEVSVTTIDDAEKRLILETLRHCRNNKSKAARMLGIGRNTLWRKLKQFKEAP